MEVPQLRLNLWLDNYEEYNCSAFGDIVWPSKGVKRLNLGLFCIAYGAVTIPLYSALAMIVSSMRQLSVYKIMIYMAAVDIWSLMFASIGFGLLSIIGEVYCAHPRLVLLYSLACECEILNPNSRVPILFSPVFHFCSSACCTLLALNRFGEMLSIPILCWMFQGMRTWLVLVMCTSAVGVFVLFTPPLLFNSNHHMLFFDPMIFEGRFAYESYIHIALVVFLPITSFCLYILTFIGLRHQHGHILKAEESKTLNKATFQLLIQSGLVIGTHLSACLLFQTLQFMPTNAVDSMLYVAHFVWMLTHGTPPFVYLTVNHAIREKFFNRMKNRRRSSVATITLH